MNKAERVIEPINLKEPTAAPQKWRTRRQETKLAEKLVDIFLARNSDVTSWFKPTEKEITKPIP